MRLRSSRLSLIMAAGAWAWLMVGLGHALLLAGAWEGGAAQAAASAPCTVSGFVLSDTTWSPTVCDPYIVSGSNLVVSTGVTLTVLSGTTIKFDSQLALSVQGTLIARGTSANPITFTSNLTVPTAGDWGYLYFTNTSADATFDVLGNYVGGSVLQYAQVEYAGGAAITRNAAVRIDAAAPYMDHNVVQDNLSYGLWSWNGAAPLMTYNVIQRNKGGVSAGSGSVVMYNQILSNTANADGGGVYVTGNVVVAYNTIAGNTASNDGGGLYLRGPGPVSNNVIVDNTAAGNGGGIFVRNGSKPPITQNDIYGNVASLGAALYNDNSPTGPALNAQYNYWGTTDPLEIENAVYHFIDDSALGLVDYNPFADGLVNVPPPAVITVWLPLIQHNYVNYFAGPWEVEENDAYTEANGPLRSGTAYLGYPDDAKDYFSVYLSQPGQLVIDRTPDSGAGGGVQMLLFYESTSDLRAVAQVAPYHIDYTGPAGWYYIYLYTASDYSPTSVYTLTVIYP